MNGTMTAAPGNLSKVFSSSGDLCDFVINSIQVPLEDQRCYNQAVDEIVRFLQTKSPTFPWKIKRVYKSGSLAKGTGVRDHVDIDLYVFIERSEILTDPKSFLRLAPQIVEDIVKKFAVRFKWQRQDSSETSWVAAANDIKEPGLPFIPLYKDHNDGLIVLTMMQVRKKVKQTYSLRLAREEKSMMFDMDINVVFDLQDYLGCQDLESRSGSTKIFSYINNQPNPAEFAKQICPSLAELNFMGNRLNSGLNSNENLKKLILLVKWWYKNEVPTDIKFKSALLELLCLGVWESILKDMRFDLVDWFGETLIALLRYRKIGCYWTDFYELSIVPQSLKNQRPLILDPENPWRNMASKSDWENLSKYAMKFIKIYLPRSDMSSYLEPM